MSELFKSIVKRNNKNTYFKDYPGFHHKIVHGADTPYYGRGYLGLLGKPLVTKNVFHTAVDFAQKKLLSHPQGAWVAASFDGVIVKIATCSVASELWKEYLLVKVLDFMGKQVVHEIGFEHPRDWNSPLIKRLSAFYEGNHEFLLRVIKTNDALNDGWFWQIMSCHLSTDPEKVAIYGIAKANSLAARQALPENERPLYDELCELHHTLIEQEYAMKKEATA